MVTLFSIALAGNGFDYNHPDVRWHTLETDHFLIHWPESRKPKDHPHYFTAAWTAGQLSEIAETSYPLITAQFDYELREKTHIMLYDQDLGWEGNGFAIAEQDFTGFPGMWGPLFRQRGRAEFLEDVFVHEFAHIVSLKAYLPFSEDATYLEIGGLVEDEEWLKRWGLKGRGSNMNFDVGASLLISAHTPFWWAEGGAEFWSHQAGYNNWGTSREAYLRTTFLENRVLTKEEWTTRADKEGMDGERGYNQGYSFGLFLYDRFGLDEDGMDLYSKMAKLSGERWHWTWDKVVERATGKDADWLYDAWYMDRKARYERKRFEVTKRGIVVGGELSLTRPRWEIPGDEKWARWSKKDREEALDGETSVIEYAATSPDGQFFAWYENGLNIRKIRPEQWGAIGGTWVDREDDDTLEAFADQTTNHWWPYGWKSQWSPDSRRLLVTASEDTTDETLMDLGLTANLDGKAWNQLFIGTVDDSGKKLKVDWKGIPNTLRAEESAWHPDGQRVVFSRYDDGTTDLYIIGVDGTGKERLSSFGDGAQIQGLSFTPDGNTIVTSLFKNFQQDLFLFHLDTRTWERLTDSAGDEVDPTLGPDGRIWFGSDVDGISNIYSLDPATGEVRKQTEVLGHAYAPDVTPEGHLFYNNMTGHGFRVFGLNKEALKNQLVQYPGVCRNDDTICNDTDGFITHKPVIRDAVAESKPYSILKSTLPLNLSPVLRTTDKNVELGGNFYLSDYHEEHAIEATATAGKDTYLSATYYNSMFVPQLAMGFSRYSYKGTYGYGTDADGIAETDDVTVVDVKFEQVSSDAWLFASYYLNDALYFGAGVDYSRTAFRDAGDGPLWNTYLDTVGLSLYGEWSPSGSNYSGDDWINPRGSRRVFVDYSYRISNVTDREIAGRVIDDGQKFDRYGFHRVSVGWTEWIPVFEHSTLQIDLEGGWISRNVMGWDEFGAGGRHPYHWGNGTVGNNVQFSGYEGYSLSGETLLISNVGYRFPLARDLNVKLGPTYTDSLYLQVFGTAGNLWSYRVEGDNHLEGYSVVPDDPDNVRREVPFKDYSYKNSPAGRPNYLLADAGVELRVRQFIWNDFDWDSFIRVSYGFQPTAGYGDVNADLIQSSVARDAASELSNEIEKPTIRIYAGLGTGW